MIKFIIFLATLSLMLLACQTQELENYDPNYKGKWRSDRYFSPTVGDSIQNYLIVDGRNSGIGIGCEVACSMCNCLLFQSGRAKINTKNNQLQVGGTVNQIMVITQTPLEDENGIWTLALDNVIYVKHD